MWEQVDFLMKKFNKTFFGFKVPGKGAGGELTANATQVMGPGSFWGAK